MAKIYPSLMGADLLNLQRSIETLQNDADGFHIDIMDNQFVPNITWGADTVNAIAKLSQCPLWIHLMVINPRIWNKKLTLPEGTLITFHLEIEKEIEETIKEIKEKKCRPSIAINPKTTLEEIFPFLHRIDHIVCMSVNPGFTGQQFLEDVTTKIEALNEHRTTHSLNYDIGADGGITKHNIMDLAQRGVNDYAISGGIFSAKDPLQALKDLKKLLQQNNAHPFS